MGKDYKPEYDLISSLDNLMTRLNRAACKKFPCPFRMIRMRRLQKRIDAITRLIKFELGQASQSED